jgi:hypothetical protein
MQPTISHVLVIWVVLEWVWVVWWAKGRCECQLAHP